jgi:hypothetical protein
LWYFFKPKAENPAAVTNPGGGINPASQPPAASTESFPLTLGMQGMNVKRLQTALNWIRPANNLQLDGVLGSKTIGALYATVSSTLSQQPISENAFNQIIALGNRAKGV